MAIVINLDLMLAKRKMKSNELANGIGITQQNLSILKTGQGQGHPPDHPGCHLPVPGLPARVCPGVGTGPGIK
jgi:hypothetical protein